MTDQDIIDFFIVDGKITPTKTSDKYLSNNRPDIKEYLINRYEDSTKYVEIIARIYHKIDNIPTCQYCGKKLKYRNFKSPYSKWCGPACQLRDPQFIAERTKTMNYDIINQKSKQTKLEKYGDASYNNKNKTKQTCLERYGVETPLQSIEVREKSKQTCLEKYGVDNPSKSQIVIDKISKTKEARYGDAHYVNREKVKQTMLERYGVESYMDTEEFAKSRNSKQTREKVKQTMLERYGVSSIFASPSFLQKRKEYCLKKYGVEAYSQTEEFKKLVYNTKTKNHTFNTSSIEKQIIEYLDNNSINYKYQYKSKQYPFNCDFYFPELDLYFEIQGNWTHGKHPFDVNSQEDLDILNMWKSKNTKYYNKAIQVWTVDDVKKRNFAISNNLNWIECFSIDFDEVVEFINPYIL